MMINALWLRLVAAVLCSLCLIFGSHQAHGGELLVSSAVSLKEAVEAAGRRFQGDRAGVLLRYNFGASGALQKQIEGGAPVDAFLSAGQLEMDALERRGLLLAASRRVLASNSLVVIAPVDSGISLLRPSDLLRREVVRLTIGNPKTVPAGQYAEECLKTLGLWEALRPRLVLGENVRQVLEYVARGEADAGIVYVTDIATQRERVREAFRPRPDSHRPIVYPAAVVADSGSPHLAGAFVDFLAAPEGQAILARYGFVVTGPVR
jgi:molybdate transport system substrate-binding protein